MLIISVDTFSKMSCLEDSVLDSHFSSWNISILKSQVLMIIPFTSLSLIIGSPGSLQRLCSRVPASPRGRHGKYMLAHGQEYLLYVAKQRNTILHASSLLSHADDKARRILPLFWPPKKKSLTEALYGP